MNGKKMKLETVECPVEELSTALSGDTRKNKQKHQLDSTHAHQEKKEIKDAQIISFSDLKNRQKDHEPDPG